jgi:hypothetical protein
VKDTVALLLLAPLLATLDTEQLTFWERMLEKWGIGLVGIGAFCALAWWTNKRETKLQEERDKREAADRAERLALATRNNELQEAQLKALSDHAQRIEQLTKDGNRSRDDHASALRMLMRKFKRPCVDFEQLSHDLPDSLKPRD